MYTIAYETSDKFKEMIKIIILQISSTNPNHLGRNESIIQTIPTTTTNHSGTEQPK